MPSCMHCMYGITHYCNWGLRLVTSIQQLEPLLMQVWATFLEDRELVPGHEGAERLGSIWR